MSKQRHLVVTVLEWSPDFGYLTIKQFPKGWRLPTLEEFKQAFEHKRCIFTHPAEKYWVSRGQGDVGCIIPITRDSYTHNSYEVTFRARLVRDLTPTGITIPTRKSVSNVQVKICSVN